MGKIESKNELPNFILLPPISRVLKLLNLTSINSLIDFLKIVVANSNFSNLDNVTIMNILMKENSSNKKTKKNVTDALPNYEEINEIFKNHTDTYTSSTPTYWENILKGFSHDYFKEEFPFSLMQISNVIQYERLLLQSMLNAQDLSVLLENEWIKRIFNKTEIDEIKSNLKSSDESGKFLIKAMFKTILYCIAYIDAEISISDIKNIYKKSRLYKLLPKFDSNKYVDPVELLFRHWKEGSGHSYTFMEQFISGKNKESKKSKFKKWRRSDNIAKAYEIKNIAKGIFPQIKDNEYQLNVAIIGYYIAVFFSKLFQFMLNARLHDRIDIFNIDSELVEWIDTHYTQYIEIASNEYLEFTSK